MQYVLARGESGRLYMYEKEIWEFLEKDKTFADSDILIKVVEGDDLVLLRQMQSLVNKDMKIEGE